MPLDYLDIDAFRATALVKQPFEYLIVPNFVRPESCVRVNADYPAISEGGSFPVTKLTYGTAFQTLLDELESDEFRVAFEQKFAIDLSDRPTTITVRGRCSARDGQIHNDSKSKIITVLIYMNPSWEQSGGRLRLLRSGSDLDDMIVEVPPSEGTLLAFKRADNSWHGHKPSVGDRRVIQFNWVTSEGNRRIAMLRHHVSAPFKRMLAALRQSRSPGVLASGRD
jgi:hypothetical protein